MKIIEKSIDELIPYENNARFNDEAVEFVANSIKEFGMKNPILVDKNMVIIAGHTRLKALKKLGWEKAPVIIAEDLDEEQVKALRLADNKAGEIAQWDEDLLAIEMQNIKNIDMDKFGFELQKMLDEAMAKDNVQERKLKKMELKAFEHYDYLVFVFDNQHDFVGMAQEFGLEKVDAGYTVRKLGIGRVLKGGELVKRLRDKNNNIE
ncbi:MAG TPA: ParB N-terminal domain-containing protein [Acholeplasmataceae bacterium]|nr:ParB N-terminal domain-containing protein [Acholeplasmataceae bacterium]